MTIVSSNKVDGPLTTLLFRPFSASRYNPRILGVVLNNATGDDIMQRIETLKRDEMESSMSVLVILLTPMLTLWPIMTQTQPQI